MAVHEAMKTLPEHCAEILDRFFTQDESYKTIGEALDLPPGHDRESHLEMPFEAPESTRGKKAAVPAVNQTDDPQNMTHTTKSELPSCCGRYLRRPRRGSRPLRSFPEPAARSTRSPRESRLTRSSGQPLTADLEAALEAAGYDIDPSLLPALRERLSSV